MSIDHNAAGEKPEIRSVHPGDLAVFLVTTTLCALGALMLPLAG